MSRLNINPIQISIKAYGAFYKYDNLLLQKVVNSSEQPRVQFIRTIISCYADYVYYGLHDYGYKIISDPPAFFSFAVNDPAIIWLSLG